MRPSLGRLKLSLNKPPDVSGSRNLKPYFQLLRGPYAGRIRHEHIIRNGNRLAGRGKHPACSVCGSHQHGLIIQPFQLDGRMNVETRHGLDQSGHVFLVLICQPNQIAPFDLVAESSQGKLTLMNVAKFPEIAIMRRRQRISPVRVCLALNLNPADACHHDRPQKAGAGQTQGGRIFDRQCGMGSSRTAGAPEFLRCIGGKAGIDDEPIADRRHLKRKAATMRTPR